MKSLYSFHHNVFIDYCITLKNVNKNNYQVNFDYFRNYKFRDNIKKPFFYRSNIKKLTFRCRSIKDTINNIPSLSKSIGDLPLSEVSKRECYKLDYITMR